MGIFNRPELRPVTEKYVGNSAKEFPIIEAELKKIIDMIRKAQAPIFDPNRKIISQLNSRELNKSDHNKLIEKMFKQLFGLKDFILLWDTTSEPNALTPCKTFQLLDPNFKKDASGHRTNSALTVGVNVNAGLVIYANLNEKELLAIILHEIGHNFYNSAFQILARLPISALYVMYVPNIVPLILQTVAIQGIMDVIEFPTILQKTKRFFQNLLYEYVPKVMQLIDTFKDISYNVQTLFPKQSSIMGALMASLRTGGPLSASYLFLYNVEKHADSFAVDYGYGKDLASGLTKLREQEGSLGANIYKIPVMNWVYDLYDLQYEIIVRCISGYPSEQNRIRTGLDRLKRSANDPSLDPRVRKELEQQIKEYEDFYQNEYLSWEKDANRGRVFTWLYANMVESVFGGKMDLREIIHAMDPHKYK